jgi:hypothetical protein
MAYPPRDQPDQVPRLRAFQAAHPDITIVSPAESGTLRWSARRGGAVLCTELDLAHLLDRLERLLEQGELGPARPRVVQVNHSSPVRPGQRAARRRGVVHVNHLGSGDPG